MNRTILPGKRSGRVSIPASKSQAHRLLICAALSDRETQIHCGAISKDITATAQCLRALGANVNINDCGVIRLKPIKEPPYGQCELYCGESGSTLRFLLPLVGALGAQAVFHMEGRLPERPRAPLDEELIAHGMSIEKRGALLYCGGKLRAGEYTLPGSVSSQYISGLLMALPHISGDSNLNITGATESAAYITMTLDALRQSCVTINQREGGYDIPGGQRCCLPESLRVEGDWSNAAFFLCMGALSDKGMLVEGLNMASSQGDRGVLDILHRFGAEVSERENGVFVRKAALRGITVDAAQVPDLIPVLSVLAACAEGETRVINAARLRLKESDRLQSSANMLKALGAEVEELPDGLIIKGGALHGGEVDSCRDHRIAMSAAVAACAAEGSVSVTDENCVEKSYPCFWQDFDSLEVDRA